MGLIFKVGEHSDFPAVPKNFPTCGSWLPPIDEENEDSIVATTIESDSDSQMNDTIKSNSIDIDLFLSNTINSRPETKTVGSTTPNIKVYQDNFILPHRLVNGSLSQLGASLPAFTSGVHKRYTESNMLMAYFFSFLIVINLR